MVLEQLDSKGKTRKKSKVTKNEMMRDLVTHAKYNIGFKYVLADSWFSSSENMSRNCSENPFFLFLN